jgi:hypothetical protein
MSEHDEFMPYVDFMVGQIAQMVIVAKTNYPTNAVVQYSNTTEYRACLRKLFKMKKETIDKTLSEYKDLELDEESLDELAYDDASAAKVLDAVFDATKNEPLFRHVYRLAAAFMMSEDMNIGISVLFSYDYLQYFHPCIVSFLNEPSSFNKDTPCYLGLCKKLT